MKSNFIKISQIYDSNQYGNIYYDKSSGVYYAIFDNRIIRLYDADKQAAQIAYQLEHIYKKKNKKRKPIMEGIIIALMLSITANLMENDTLKNDKEEIFQESEYNKEDTLKDKITKLVNNEAFELDYSNPEDRFLVYLYSNACLSFKQYSDIEEYMYDAVIEDNHLGINIITTEDLEDFFDNNNINGSNLKHLAIISYFKKGLPLLQEINICLQEELKENRITEEDYNEFINTCNHIIKLYNSENYDTWIDAIENNKSINNFQLKLINLEDI